MKPSRSSSAACLSVCAFGVRARHHCLLVSTSPRTPRRSPQGGSTKSTAPVPTAACGIPANSAVSGILGDHGAAARLDGVHAHRAVPPVPVSTHAIARGPYAPATDSKSRSAEGRTKCTSSLSDSVRTPVGARRGGAGSAARVDRARAARSSASASLTGSSVRRERTSASTVRCRGSRCWTTSTGTGRSGPRAPRSAPSPGCPRRTTPQPRWRTDPRSAGQPSHRRRLADLSPGG